MDLLADFLEAYVLMLARELYHIVAVFSHATTIWKIVRDSSLYQSVSKLVQLLISREEFAENASNAAC